MHLLTIHTRAPKPAKGVCTHVLAMEYMSADRFLILGILVQFYGGHLPRPRFCEMIAPLLCKKLSGPRSVADLEEILSRADPHLHLGRDVEVAAVGDDICLRKDSRVVASISAPARPADGS